VIGATKDGCKIFWTYVSQSVGSVLYIVSTKLSNFALKTSSSRNDLSSRPTVFDNILHPVYCSHPINRNVLREFIACLYFVHVVYTYLAKSVKRLFLFSLPDFVYSAE